jgi:type VI secretion system protein ImpC
MLMSVNNEIQNEGRAATVEKMLPQNGVYASLFDKINLTPVAEMGDLNGFEDNTVMAETSADERVTAAVQVTSAFDQLSAPGLKQPLPVPSESTMDSLSHAISARMDELGWKLPCMSGPCIHVPVSRKAGLCRPLAVCCLLDAVMKRWLNSLQS